MIWQENTAQSPISNAIYAIILTLVISFSGAATIFLLLGEPCLNMRLKGYPISAYYGEGFLLGLRSNVLKAICENPMADVLGKED